MLICKKTFYMAGYISIGAIIILHWLCLPSRPPTEHYWHLLHFKMEGIVECRLLPNANVTFCKVSANETNFVETNFPVDVHPSAFVHLITFEGLKMRFKFFVDPIQQVFSYSHVSQPKMWIILEM